MKLSYEWGQVEYIIHRTYKVKRGKQEFTFGDGEQITTFADGTRWKKERRGLDLEAIKASRFYVKNC